MTERLLELPVKIFADGADLHGIAELSRQPYIRDESITVEKLILQAVAAIGENVIVRRFQRWELGESLKA